MSETTKPVKVYVGNLSTGWRSAFQANQMRIIEQKYAGRVELVYPKQVCVRFEHAYARNCVVEEFLESDCDILWFIDEDIGPPDNILDLITEHGDKWQAAGAAYPVFMAQGKDPVRQVTFCVYNGGDGEHYYPWDVPTSGTAFVKGLATGCMFIKRGVFLRLERPYFQFIREHETQRAVKGEDLGFCMKLNALGINFFTDYSLACNHTKEVDLMEVSNYAMEYARKSVEQYAARIKAELGAHAKAISEKRKSQAAVSSLWVPK